jgi:hypothetical protein
MKFIAEKGSDTYDKLAAVIARIRECQAVADTLAKELGFQKYYTTGDTCGTGIASFVHYGKLPENYKRVPQGGILPNDLSRIRAKAR